jgi:hypothetical protein
MIRRALVLIAVLAGAAWLIRSGLQRRAASASSTGQPATEPSRMVASEGQAAIVLDTATKRRIGITTAVLQPLQHPGELALAGEIVNDPSALAIVRAAVSGRLTIPEGARWPAFGDPLAAGAVLGQVSDALPLTAPRSGVVSRILAQPGELVQAGQGLLEITDYGRPLARIAWGSVAPQQPPTAIFVAPAEHSTTRFPARLVGPAPEADPLTRWPAFLYRLDRGWPGARPGAAVQAFVADPKTLLRGVFIPADAVVQWDGLTWVFLERGTGRYIRTRVSAERPVPGGWLEAGDVAAGDTVVIRGAQQLLSEEFRAKIVVGEEVGE